MKKFIYPNLLVVFMLQCFYMQAQWNNQCPGIKGTNAAGVFQQGNLSQISADGKTAVCSFQSDKGIYSGFIVYKYNGSQWVKQDIVRAIVGNGSVFTLGDMALSGDGNTLAISSSQSQVLLYVYTNINGSWRLQNKFTGPGSATYPCDVSISYNGNIIVARNNVYTRQGNNWQLQYTLLPTDRPVASNIFSCDVANNFSCVARSAISADGNTIAIGDIYAPDSAVNIWMFTRTGNTWTQQGSRLSGTGNSGFAPNYAPAQIALSGDGNTAVIGNNGSPNAPKGVWVFRRINSIWVQEGNGPVNNNFSLNMPPIYSGADYTNGSILSLSHNGDVLLTDDAKGAGIIYWKRTGSSWAQQGGVHSYSAATYYDSVAYKGSFFAIAVDSAGSRAICGLSGYRGWQSPGAISFLALTGNTWAQQGPVIIEPTLSGGANQGNVVVMSADGSTMAESALYEQGDLGAVWVFKRDGANWNQIGQKLTLSAWQPATFGGSFQTYVSMGISRDGRVLVIGAPHYGATGAYSLAKGAIFVYTYNGSNYVLRDSIIGQTDIGLGSYMSLSQDGNTMVSLGYNTYPMVFTYNGSNWSQQASLSTTSTYTSTCDISGDGSTIAIGETSADNSKGALYVYRRNGNNWALETGPVHPANLLQGDQFGMALDMSYTGDRIAAGSGYGNSGKGQVYIYKRNASNIWFGYDTMPANTQASQIGNSIAMSSTGDTIATYSAFYTNPRVGMYRRNGAVWQLMPYVPRADDMDCCAGMNGSSIAGSSDLKFIAEGFLYDYDGKNGSVRMYVRTSLRDTTLQVKNATCAQVPNGKIKLRLTGGVQPYALTWSTGASNADSLVGLAPGIYRVTISDAGGDSLIREYTVGSQINVTAAGYTTTYNCGAGTGTITATGGGGTAPYTYQWNTTPPQNTATAVQLTPGAYQVTITDATGCQLADTTALTVSSTVWSTFTSNDVDCNGPGSATVEIFGGTPPYTYQWSNGATTPLNALLAAGTYTATATDAAGCSITGTAVINESCGYSIAGRVFYDKNNDCTQQQTELPARYYTMQATNGNITVFGNTNNNGDYNISTPVTGNYTVEVAHAQLCHYPLCNDSLPPVTAVITQQNAHLNNVNFPLVNIGIDLSLQINSVIPFPGSTFDYTIYYGNLQDSVLPTGQLTLSYDGALTVNSTTPPYSSIDTTNHVITWNLSNIGLLYPLGNQQVAVNFTLSAAFVPHNTILFQSHISPTSDDCNLVNNTIIQPMVVNGSLDPNYKAAYPENTLTPVDTIITYTIHFQNVGTGPTHFVEVLDTLQATVDPGSVTTIATSHLPYVFKIKESGILSWKFDPLSLPDSASNPAGSQGYVTYRVNLKPQQPLGTMVTNRASIYFDYNTPVHTNTTSNVIEDPSGIAYLQKPSALGLQLAPNPASSFTSVFVDVVAIDGTLQLTDLTGRIIALQTVTATTLQLNTSALPGGIYFVKVSAPDGRQAVKKLIIGR